MTTSTTSANRPTHVTYVNFYNCVTKVSHYKEVLHRSMDQARKFRDDYYNKLTDNGKNMSKIFTTAGTGTFYIQEIRYNY